MANANRTFRSGLLLSTAMAAMIAMPGAVHAQLVTSGDLVDAIDSGGNPGQLTVTNTSATQTDMTVLAPVVVANWTRFNVTTGTTVNIANGTVVPTATLVNRVVGATASDISGTINAADVNLWLVNQNGIVFGNGASVNSASFFASTIDVADQDVFDFYEGTDVFGNGLDRVNFAGSLGNAVTTSSPNVSFVTDGTMMFVSEQLNLDATFDAGSGKIAFLAAADVDVSFTAGSPVSYVVSAGTTVAQQTIAGSVTGNSIDVQMLTASGVVNALLQVDATLQANTAVATNTGVFLSANQAGPGTVTVEFNDTISSDGTISVFGDGDLTANAAISGSAVTAIAFGDVTLNNVTATGGNVFFSATGGNLTAGNVQATGSIGLLAASTSDLSFGSLVSTGGAVSIGGSSPNSFTVTGLTQGTSVNLSAVNGGVNLGNVTSLSGDVTLAASLTGGLTVGDVTANGGNAVVSSATTINAGAVSSVGGNVDLAATGNITTTSITATTAAMVGGAIDVDSTGGGTLNLGILNASGAITLDTTGSLTTAAITAGGALTAGAVGEPSAVTFTGNVSAGSITVDTSGVFGAQGLTATAGGIDIDAGSISAGAVSATGGDVDLVATGNVTTTSITATAAAMIGGAIDVQSAGVGTLNLGVLNASGAVDLDTGGNLTTAAITAGGALTVGATGEPVSVTFTGNASGASITVDTTGIFSAQGLTATAGGIDIDAGSITAGAVSATGGNVDLAATGNITTTSITATTAAMVGGAIDVESTGGGTFNLGTLNASGAVDLVTSGQVTAGAINAGGALTFGIDDLLSNDPITISLTGDAIAQSILIATETSSLIAQDMTATGGSIVLNGTSMSAGDLLATGAIFVQPGGGGVTLGSITSSGSFVSLNGSADQFIVTGLTQGTGVDMVMVANAVIMGDVVATAGSVNLTSVGGPLSVGNVTATNGIELTGGSSLTAGVISAGISAGGDVRLESAGNITASSVSSAANGPIGGAIDVISTGGGALNLGALTSSGAITLDTSGTLTLGEVNAGGVLDIGSTVMPSVANFNGDITAASFSFTTIDPFVAQDITTTAGNLVIDATSITAGALSATGGNVDLVATGNITTTSITATAAMMAGGAIDVGTTGGGALNLGALNASGAIALDTTGSLTTAAITAGGALTVGGANTLVFTDDPSSVTFTGNVSAASIRVDTAGNLSAADLTATSGTIVLNSRTNLTAGDVLASGDIRFSASNTGTATFASLVSTGGAVFNSGAVPGTIDVAGEVRGTEVTLSATNVIDLGNVTTTAGRVSFFAGSGGLFTGDISVTGGITQLFADGGITTGSVTSTGAITAASTGGGAIDLGEIDGDGAVTLDTTGTLATAAISAGGALTVGAGLTPASVAFGGAVSAASISIDTSGDLSASDLTALSGTVVLDAQGDITAGDVLASGDIQFGASNTGTASFASLVSTGGRVINVGFTPGTILVAGEVRGTEVGLSSVNSIDLGDVTSTAGVVFLSAGTGSLSTGDISATGGTTQLFADGAITTGLITSTGAITAASTAGGAIDLGAIDGDAAVTLDTTGSITTDAITAVGALTVGATLVPTSVAFGGAVSAGSITVDTTGALQAAGLTAAAGGVDVDATSISAGAVSATGGDVDLLATGNITTASITATAAMMAGGAIDVESTGGGTLNLGTLNASGAITLGTTGALTTGAITAGGALSVGFVLTDPLFPRPSSVTFSGNVSAADIIVSTPGDLTAADLTATAGGVVLNTEGSILAGDVLASGQIRFGASNTGSATFDSLVSTGGVISSATLTPGTTTVNGLTQGAAVDLRALEFVLGDVVATLGLVRLNSSVGAMTVGDVEAATSVNLQAGSIVADDVTANSGLIRFFTVDGVTTTSVTSLAGGIDVDSTMGGALNLGTLNASGAIALDTTGSVTTLDIVSTGGALAIGGNRIPLLDIELGEVQAASVSVIGEAALVAETVTATAGGVLVDAGSIATFGISATGGAVDLVAVDGITTGAINATLAIDVDSTDNGDVVLGNLQAGLGITLDTGGALSTGAVTATAGSLRVGDDNSPSSVTFGGNVSAQAITVSSTGEVLVGARDGMGALVARNNITATNGGIVIDSGAITAGIVSATGGDIGLLSSGDVLTGNILAVRSGGVGGAIDVESFGGALDLGVLTADLGIALDADGAIRVAGATASGGALTVGTGSSPDSVTFTGDATGQSVSILTSGDVNGLALTATAGSVTVGANAIVVGAVSATGNAGLTAVRGIQTTGAIGAGGNITVTSTGTGATAATLALGNVDAGQAVALSAGGAITAGTVNSDASSVTITSGAQIGTGAINAGGGNATLSALGDIVTGAITASGGNVVLTAAGNIGTGALTATRVGGAGGAIDIDSTNGGAIDLGPAVATNGITIDTLGTVRSAGLDAGTTSDVAIGVDRLASAVTFTGQARAANITVRTGGLFTAAQMNAGTGAIRVSARDIELGSTVTAGSVEITSTVAAPDANTPQVGLGTESGVMSLTDAELDRITAGRLLVDAGAGEVRMAGVTFADGAGSSNVDIATTGLLRITGDISGTGTARTFRLGGDAAGANTASRITADIDAVTIDFGTSTLALRGTDIVFGQQALITMLAGMSLDDQVKELIGNSASPLYTPLGLSAARIANPTYLTAGRLSVTYGGSALFQNSATPGGASAFEGVRLGGMGAAPGAPLQLNPLVAPNVVGTEVVDGNVFALFGSINGTTGPAASLGGSSVIEVNSNVLVTASRVNGCIIGSAEGCITTIVGNFVLIVPRELISPIVAEEGVPLPFDPLVGTNNESLFSDAASAPENDETCRERNAAGVCVGK